MRLPRPIRRLAGTLVVLAVVAAPTRSALAQTFVRVTDPTNPIVTDTEQSGGGCWIDLVGDGYLDLFVANGNLTNQPNALYRNTRSGGFVRVATGPVTSDGGSSIGGTFGDFDNDGLPDLFVTNRNSFGNFLYRGAGDTLFTKITSGGPVTDLGNSNSSSWVDLDDDGALDLYVINFQGNDFLYHNDGPPNFTFTRIDTTAMTPGTEFSIPAAWADYNGDGLDDAFIGNAGTQNDYLYTNHGHLWFTRTTFTDAKSTLGASWGDYDNDGWLDLIVAHYSGQKNTLYHNSGPPGFTLTPLTAGAVNNDIGSWVGSAWGDYDNDGNLDLYMANDGAPGALYHNDGPPAYGFTKVTSGAIATDVGNAFGAVWGDYDRDGQLDLFVSDHNGAGNRLYHNQGTANHWVTVRLRGTASNRSGIGAKIRVLATIGGTPRWQMREVTGQTGYNSQNLDQHFGLGDATVIDTLRIEWPSGQRDNWTHAGVDAILRLVEGTDPTAVAPSAAPGPADAELDPVRPNPCRGGATLGFALAHAGRATLEVFDLRGRRVARVLDAALAAGRHEARFSVPPGTPAGVYFCRLATAGQTRVARLVVMR